MQVLQFLKMKHNVVTSWRLSGLDMKLEYSNKPLIGRKELGTPKNPTVLEDPPTSTDKDMVDLFFYPSGIAIPSPAVQHWYLIPGTRNSQPSGSCKFQKERAVAKTCFIATPFSVSDNIKVAQDNECITTGTLVQYRVEFGVEHLLVSFTHLGRSIHCNNRYEV